MKKGNLRLMYQDFRFGEFEKPGENRILRDFNFTNASLCKIDFT